MRGECQSPRGRQARNNEKPKHCVTVRRGNRFTRTPQKGAFLLARTIYSLGMNHDDQPMFNSAPNLKSQSPSPLATCTRRQFAKWSLAALPGVGFLSVLNRARAADTSQ